MPISADVIQALVPREGGDATEETAVHQGVVHGVDGHGHVPGLGDGAGVEVPVVLRHEVDVVEDEALPVRVVPQRLREAHVEQQGPVELGVSGLESEIGLWTWTLPHVQHGKLPGQRRTLRRQVAAVTGWDGYG